MWNYGKRADQRYKMRDCYSRYCPRVVEPGKIRNVKFALAKPKNILLIFIYSTIIWKQQRNCFKSLTIFFASCMDFQLIKNTISVAALIQDFGKILSRCNYTMGFTKCVTYENDPDTC